MITRLKLFIESIGISISAFEQKISASDGLIRRAVKNNSDIQSKWLTNISDNYPDLNIEWLITGKGEMFNHQSSIHIFNVGTGNLGNVKNNAIKQCTDSLICHEKIKLLEKIIKEKDSLLKAKDEIIDLLKKQVLND